MSTERELPIINEFAELYARRQNLASRVVTDEKVRQLLVAGIKNADKRLAELAENPEVRAHYSRLGGQIVEIARQRRSFVELEESAEDLIALGLEEDLNAQRLEIIRSVVEAEENNPHHAATIFFLKLSGVEQILLAEDTAGEVSKAPEDQPPAVGEEGEAKKPELLIEVDPKKNVSINGEPVSLDRKLEIGGKIGQETRGKQLRIDVLRFLIGNHEANNPKTEFSANEIWSSLYPGQTIDKNLWNLFIRDFLGEEFTYQAQPIVTVRNIHPRLLGYSIQNFDVSIRETENILNVGNEGVHVLENGRAVAGDVGKFLNALSTRSKQNLATDEILSEIYSREELDAMDGKRRRSALASLASRARRELLAVGKTLTAHPTGEKYPNTGRQIIGYYVSEINEQSDIEQELEAILPLKEANMLAGFLHFNSSTLNKKGLEELPSDIAEKLRERTKKIRHDPPKEQTSGERKREIMRVRAQAINNDEQLQNALNIFKANRDVRGHLLKHISEAYSDEQKKAFLKELLESQEGNGLRVQTRHKGIEISKPAPSTPDNNGGERSM
jgi:hypothetical protein